SGSLSQKPPPERRGFLHWGDGNGNRGGVGHWLAGQLEPQRQALVVDPADCRQPASNAPPITLLAVIPEQKHAI
ncbi:hypothetical protein, partial [Burkholderia sp. 22313]|uniref:hypothetical protein n=1 Tax=Burkholderia sp. 22313 TaxID=3453908 RepID=UPI003F83BB6E